MQKENIKTKLINSDAYKSLVAERKVSGALTRFGWSIVHGCYYTDPQEQKLRELDILACKSWKKRSSGTETLRGQVLLVAECKSADDYHLLFSESKAPRKYNKYLSWIGNVEEERDLLIALNDLQMSQADGAELFRSFEKLANIKNHWVIRNLIPKIAPAPVSACAFRETNTKHDRDLAAAILWKAGQTVNSAIESFRKEATTAAISDFKIGSEIALLKGESPLPYIIEVFSRRVKSVDFFHPVVFIESQLWKFTRNDLSRIKWCRLERNDSYSHRDWIDVVSYNVLEEYLDRITLWYDEEFKKVLAEPVK